MGWDGIGTGWDIPGFIILVTRTSNEPSTNSSRWCFSDDTPEASYSDGRQFTPRAKYHREGQFRLFQSAPIRQILHRQMSGRALHE